MKRILLIFLVIGCGGPELPKKEITQCDTSFNNCLDKGRSFVGPGSSTMAVWTDCQRTYEACMGTRTP